MSHNEISVAVFDFDGTMIDSDQALVDPFLALGVPPEEISFGHAVAAECDRLGIDLGDYVDAYDTGISQPFPGVEELVGNLGRWAICSNKHPSSADAELARLGWHPELVMCADAFGWHHKSLVPVIEAMGIQAEQVVMVGDSEGDLRCAQEIGCQMVWAGWNPRVRAAKPSGLTASEPAELLDWFPAIGGGV